MSTLDSRLAWGYYGLLAAAFWLLIRKRPLTGLPTPEHKQKEQTAPRKIMRIVQAGIAACIVLTTALAIYVAPSSGPFTLTFLAVGPAKQPLQGEAILIRTSSGQTIVIDGGLDSVSLSQELDSHLPPWQRKLDLVVLTAPLHDHLDGLLDVQSRYQIGAIIDPGMLHPNATYAQWRRNISESKQLYMQVHQGMSMALGNGTLQVLWPVQLHKSADEGWDNSLIVRLVLPGLSILLLNAAAQSRYALAGLLESINSNYLQAAIVQMVGAPGKTFPVEMKEVLQKVHPQFLVVSPAALSAKQRTMGLSTPAVPVPQAEVRGEDWQTIETVQTGTVEIQSQQASWNITTVQ